MFLSGRQTEILEIAKAEGRVLVEELALRFSVTPQTIRKDLNDLCDGRVLSRVHGGAIFPGGTENVKSRGALAPSPPPKSRRSAAPRGPHSCNTSLFINIGTTSEAAVAGSVCATTN